MKTDTRKIWLSGDYHFGENRFELMGRPFTTISENVQTIIKNHNEWVGPGDEVIVVGDVCYQKTPEFLENVKKMNGRKILIRGNHDRPISDEEFLKYFDMVIPEGEGYYITLLDDAPNGDVQIPCYITHYPTCGKKNYFNLCGHIHGAWKYQLNCMNVGVDVNHFRPVNINRIPFHLRAIKEFYDRDVWVAYDEINSSYRDERGKKSRYLDAK